MRQIRMVIFGFAACAGIALAQAAFVAPRLGCALDGRGNLRMVWGVRGNFLLGETVMEAVESAACSAAGGLVKTRDALVIVDAAGSELDRRQASSGEALFAFDAAGQPAFAHLLFSRQTLRWTGSEWEEFPGSWEGETLAIADAGDGAMLALAERDDEVWLLRVEGGGVVVLRRVSASSPAGMVFPDGRVFLAQRGSLVMYAADGTATRIKTAAPVRRLSMMGDGWIHATADGLDLAFQMDGGRVWFLPR